MNPQNLRAIILKLHDRLSDNDRKRLHFFFGDEIPRRVRDDQSLCGTLSLMESLFDQDKINEHDFTILINAFEQIGCTDAVKLLKGHMKQVQLNETKQSLSSLSVIMPSTTESSFSSQQIDKQTVNNSLNYQKLACANNNNLLHSTNASINPFTLIVNNHTSSSSSKRKYIFGLNSTILRYSILLPIILLTCCVILLSLFLYTLYHSNKQLKEKHEKIERLHILQLESNKTIEHLNSQLNYLESHYILRTLPIRTKWTKSGITVAGGNENGHATNQLNWPLSVYLDQQKTLYIVDKGNHRITKWKSGSRTGLLVVGGNGYGNRTDQLNTPTDMVFDKYTNNFIICDRANRRIVQWSLENGTTHGDTLIANIHCWGLMIDEQRNLYISDTDNAQVIRYSLDDKNEKIVAGGMGKGNKLNQLNYPTYLFVDRDQSIYVSDSSNHRVMKWTKGAKFGIIVAGGRSRGNALTQLSQPHGLSVDSSGTIYIADTENNRIMRWRKGSMQGDIILGGYGEGKAAIQFNYPHHFKFDQYGHLYVVDSLNDRIQKFHIESLN